VEVVVEEDLVDKVKPGDRIQVYGVYKCFSTASTIFNGIFKTMLIATNI
jgi:DNA replication licensing factor MCM3